GDWPAAAEGRLGAVVSDVAAAGKPVAARRGESSLYEATVATATLPNTSAPATTTTREPRPEPRLRAGANKPGDRPAPTGWTSGDRVVPASLLRAPMARS